MATSPSHQVGEWIGDFFENSIINYLKPIIMKKGFYLDYRHPRAARNYRKEVIGIDKEGNKHKLDIVIEKNGSENTFGIPKAYIEMAWRRYVKHSKNKVQEIAGAIRPLVATNAQSMPFYAAVLAGEFTQNSINQLRSQGFYVIYFNYDEICALFEKHGISIRWEESTSEATLNQIVEVLYSLPDTIKQDIQNSFYCIYREKLIDLTNALLEALATVIAQIIVVHIHGFVTTLQSIEDAIGFIMNYDENTKAPILSYEITIRYNNGEEYIMKCKDKTKAIQFLNQYRGK